MDGLAVCAEARRDPKTRHIPIVMLTARGDEADRIVGLELGADDYVVKPFSPKELVARVRALFRRLDRNGEEQAAALVRRPGGRPHAPHRDLARASPCTSRRRSSRCWWRSWRRKGRVLSRQALLENVWGYSYAEGTRTVDVHVRRLREKIPELAPFILTVKSMGYRLAEA